VLVAALCVLTACDSHTPKPVPSASPSTQASVSFPASIYPASVRGRPGAVARCPAPTHLRPADRLRPRQAISLVRHLHTISLADDLQNADRAYWPSLRSGWRHQRTPVDAYDGRILLAGKLARLQGFGVPSTLKGWVRTSCGHAVARASFVVVTGPRRSPALQVASVMVNRAGHPLVYFVYP